MKNTTKLTISSTFHTDNRISTVNFSQNDIGKIIQNPNANKAYGHDNINVHMLKMCGPIINRPLELILKEGSIGLFQSEQKNYLSVS